jgi:hypothetical protein
MKQILAAQLAEWIDNNTQGFTKRDGNIINIEGKIDAYELLVYAQSLQPARSTEQIHADNKASYTGRSVNAAVEGADYVFVED